MAESYVPDIVIYHDNCADGFGAAWACWQKWGDKVRYVPASYGAAPPDVTDAHVLIVDFSYKRGILAKMATCAKSIIVLDHHKTAQAELDPFRVSATAAELGNSISTAIALAVEATGNAPVFAVFDMEKSGARLAWDFCHGTEAPQLIRLIEDRDLWRFTLPKSKEFALWLRAEPFSFERFDQTAQELDDAICAHGIMIEATAMQRFYDLKVAEIAAFAKRRHIGGHGGVVVVNCPPMFASDVGNALLELHPDAPFAATWFEGSNTLMWSLRSKDDRVDVSVVAAKFGGGGHRNAAGFAVPA